MTHNPRGIPDGVKFGNKVVRIPPTRQNFDRPIWVQTKCGGRPKESCEQYTWVKKGENLVKFIIPITAVPLTLRYGGLIRP